MMSFSKADFRRKSLWFNLDAATLSLIRSSSLSETKNLSCFARFRGIENGSFPRRLQRELRGNPLASYFVAHEVLSLIHISEPTRLGMISYAVFCLKKKKTKKKTL